MEPITKLVFSPSGRHLLDHAPLAKRSTRLLIDSIHQRLRSLAIDPDEVLVDGSTVLALYGIRDSADLDLMPINEPAAGKLNAAGADNHDSQLRYHAVTREELATDRDLHVAYAGLRFVSFAQLYRMKGNRREAKDVLDRRMMQSCIENRRFGYRVARAMQMTNYLFLKARRRLMVAAIGLSRMLGVYPQARRFYLKLTGRSDGFR